MTATLPRMILQPPSGFFYDKRREEGWELLEEGPLVEGTPTLDFLGFLREGEEYIDGETVLARASEMDGTDSGQHHLERMLRQADPIPVELRPYWLLATGTKWRCPDGFVYFPCLNFLGGQWVLSFERVDDDGGWNDLGRVVRVRK